MGVSPPDLTQRLWDERFPEQAAVSATIGGPSSSARYDAAKRMFTWLVSDADGRDMALSAINAGTALPESEAIADTESISLGTAEVIFGGTSQRCQPDAPLIRLMSVGDTSPLEPITLLQGRVTGLSSPDRRIVKLLRLPLLADLGAAIWCVDEILGAYLRTMDTDDCCDCRSDGIASIHRLMSLTFDDIGAGADFAVYRLNFGQFSEYAIRSL